MPPKKNPKTPKKEAPPAKKEAPPAKKAAAPAKAAGSKGGESKYVPENILKKQARDAKVLKALADSRAKAKKDRAEARKVATANAEKYHKEYTDADAALVKAKRDAKAAGSFYVEGEPKVAFVIRIKGYVWFFLPLSNFIKSTLNHFCSVKILNIDNLFFI